MKPAETNLDPRVLYADIIDLPRWEPKRHPRMSAEQRAAQFAPFAALAGYEDMVSEEARITGREIDPGDEEQALLNRRLGRVARAAEAGLRPEMEITCFVPDAVKAGGEYVTFTAAVRRVDPVARALVLVRAPGVPGVSDTVPLGRIIGLRGGPAEDPEAE